MTVFDSVTVSLIILGTPSFSLIRAYPFPILSSHFGVTYISMS